MKLKERLFLQQLRWRTRPSLIKKGLMHKKIRPSGSCERLDRHSVKVGATQLEARLYINPLDYVEEMCRHTEKAAQAGVQLLVFPENNSFQLLGLIPGISAMAEKLTAGNSPLRVADLFRFAAPAMNRVALQVFAYLAKAYGIYIMAGSFPYPEAGAIWNRAFLFSPDGTPAGQQDKVHLMPLEKTWGLAAGTCFHVFATPLGRLAMPVCMDASYFETFRLLEQRGAEIVMVPIANAEPYNFWPALRGIWPRVQESTVYGIKSALVGELLGFSLSGKAGVFAPLELTPQRDGVLKEAPYFDREALVTAVLDLEALAELKKKHPYLGDRNAAFTQKYFPSVYFLGATGASLSTTVTHSVSAV